MIWSQPRRLGRGDETQPPPAGRVVCGETQRFLLGFTSFNPTYGWPAFTQQIRTARNEAGHPTSVDPITPETVHALLLIFPELAKLGSELKSWVSQHYT
jgi:hypothetical protein